MLCYLFGLNDLFQRMLADDDTRLNCGHRYHAHCIYDAYSRNHICCSLCNREITSDDLKKIHEEVLQKLIALLILLSRPIQALQSIERIRNIISIHQQHLQLAIDQEQMQIVLQQNERDLQAQSARIQREHRQLQSNQLRLQARQEQINGQQHQLDNAHQEMERNRVRLNMQQRNNQERILVEAVICSATFVCVIAILFYTFL